MDFAGLPQGSSAMKAVSELQVKIFGDGADLAGILELSRLPYIKGFTTNPTLMRKAGVPDYEEFAAEVLRSIKELPVSFEVFADDEETMEAQAKHIASWAKNVYVKIPVTNTKREPMYELIRRLSHEGIQINVTAMMTLEQVREVGKALEGGAASNVSVFAGRVADTGRDPVPMMREALEILAGNPGTELIWASPRELLNIFQADEIGCHIITVTNDILAKLKLVGKDLGDFSLDTVQMFHNDAAKAGYALGVAETSRRAKVSKR
jgi:transaldolase